MTTKLAAHVDAVSRPTLAVVLATRVSGALPGDRLAGISLALRAVLTLAKEGVTRIVLVVDSDDEAVALATIADSRVHASVEHWARPSSESPVETAFRAARSLAGPAERDEGAERSGPAPAPAVLIARHDVVVAPVVYRALSAELSGTAEGVLARCRSGDATGASVAGPMIVSARLARAAPSEPATATRDIDADIEGLLARGAIRTFDVPGWGERVSEPSGRRRAFDALFEACRKSVDGIVARHINRHISIFISKRLVDGPITPNMMSVFTLLLGLVGAASAARGGYFATLLGAALWQANSILDGVDGELARVRFQHSRLGQWIDTVSDDVSNVAFWAALGYGAAALPHGGLLSLAGYVAAGSNAVVAVIYYVELIAVGSGDVYDVAWEVYNKPAQGILGKLTLAVAYVLKKDFFILLCLVLAALGVLTWMLPVVGAFGFGLMVAAVTRAARRALSRRTRQAQAVA